jgi:hypothetical protein
VFKRSWDYWLLWVVAILSLGLNLWMINMFLNVRRQAGDGAATAARVVSNLRESVITYTVNIEQALPVSLTVPFSTTINVPLSTTLPIDTDVTIPLDTPFGLIPINIPIRTTVPINFSTKFPVNVVVPISTTVPVKLDVPIQLELGKTDFGSSLQSLQTYLESIASQLRTNPFAGK